MHLILLGAPGAGKGTQARYLANFYNVPLISTGDILRASVRDKTELGLKVKTIMETGALVSDDVIVELMRDRLKQPDCANGYLLDGFPRTLPQATAIQQAGIVIDYVIEIDVPDDDIIERLSGRRTHIESGRVYHIKHNPPKADGFDDVTGEPLVLRDDDKVETIRKRLQIYHTETKPLIDYYKKLCETNCNRTHYIRVDGTGMIDNINIRITEALKKDS